MNQNTIAEVTAREPPYSEAMRDAMTAFPKSGTVFVKRGTLLPQLGAETFGIGGWNMLPGLESKQMEERVREQKWHFFYIVPAIVRRAVTLSRHAAIAKALGGIFASLEDQGLNAAEILDVDVRRIARIYVAKVLVQPRHIRKDPLIADLKPHRWAGTEVPVAESTVVAKESALAAEAA